MNKPIWRYFFHFQAFRHATVSLAMLAWSMVAICGPIHEAARNGDLERVKMLLKDTPELVSSKDDLSAYGYTPLHWAASKDHKDVVEFLLANDAEVNVRDNHGSTPLHIAAQLGLTSMMEFLLANKAEINARDNINWMPLHIAVVGAKKEVAQLLLADKAEANAKDNNGYTPLHMAALAGHKDLVELLLANKAEINARDNDGFAPLHMAALGGHKDVASLLLANKAEINAKDNDGFTPLSIARQQGCTTVAEFLLANEAEDITKGNGGLTPLDMAAVKGMAELLSRRDSGNGEGVRGGPYAVGNGVKQPVPLSQPLPPYTEAARRARIEGVVTLRAIIRKNGTVDSMKILKRLSYGLDRSAMNTIADKWRFSPGTLNGTPVDVVANIEVRFRIF
jgi:TonB family protein